MIAEVLGFGATGTILGLLLAAGDPKTLSSYPVALVNWLVIPLLLGMVFSIVIALILSTFCSKESNLKKTEKDEEIDDRGLPGKPELGDEVENMISGARGIVVIYQQHLTGCDRITIQPKIGADGKEPDWTSFDITIARILRKKVVVPKTAEELIEGVRKVVEERLPNTKGGPAPTPTRRMSPKKEKSI